MALPVLEDENGGAICDKLAEQLQGQPDKLTKVFSFLIENEHKTACIEVLKLFLNHRGAFRKLVNFLVDDIDQLERNPAYEMAKIWVTVVPTNATGTGQLPSDLQLRRAKKERLELLSTSLLVSILEKKNILTPEKVSKLLPLYVTFKPPLGLTLEETIRMAQKLFGHRYEIPVGLGFFAYDVWKSWNRWNNCEISGVRCIKKIVDSFAELAPGVAGIYAGRVFGSAIAPPFASSIAQLVGGVGGGLASAFLAGKLSKRFTRWIFDLPEDESLIENVFCAFRLRRSLFMTHST